MRRDIFKRIAEAVGGRMSAIHAAPPNRSSVPLLLLMLLVAPNLVLAVECGIFVAPGGIDHAACGLSPDDPCATIDYGSQRAATLAEKCVFVQAGSYSGIVRLRDGVSIIGGYDANWEFGSYSTPGHAVTIAGGFHAGSSEYLSVYADAVASGAGLQNVVVQAPDAIGTSLGSGRSSYGILLRDAAGILLEDLNVLGGNGAAGTTGSGGTSATQTPAPAGSTGETGDSYTTACSEERSAGGSGGVNAAAPSSTGGRGGDGGSMDTDCSFPFDLAPTPGRPGLTGGTALGGSGGSGGGTCMGQQPQAGQSGSVANGAGGSGGGAGGSIGGGWSAWHANSGAAGSLGLNGGGGGGGGGAGGCDSGIDDRGPGGGGGGAGGAAAPFAGGGGGGGGGSFGIYAVNSSATVADCVIARGNGASGRAGGTGGSGQPGGAGGNGGAAAPDTWPGASGGAGGRGGHAGGGGGGAGGDSWGIYRVGSAITVSGVSYSGGSAGSGGAGGAGLVPGASGSNGTLGTNGAAFAPVSAADSPEPAPMKARSCDPSPCLISTDVASGEVDGLARFSFGVAPNPVQADAWLELSLPRSEPVRVTLYDVSGRSIATLVDETLAAGPHSISWNTGIREGRHLAPGVYWVRLQAGDRSIIRRVTVLR